VNSLLAAKSWKQNSKAGRRVNLERSEAKSLTLTRRPATYNGTSDLRAIDWRDCDA
jgi:hypothetical protein